MLIRRHHRAPRRAVRGLSLVELLVGVAIGLFIVAAAALMLAGQLTENRKLLAEVQLEQDLRAAMDIMTREIRRTGVLLDGNAIRGVWTSDDTGVAPNAFAAKLSPNPATPSTPALASAALEFAYQPSAAANKLGFKVEDGTVKSLRGEDLTSLAWQELTDAKAIEVTSLQFVPRVLYQRPVACPTLCSDGTTACWPVARVRVVDIAITARSRADISIVRSLSSRATLRNDFVDYYAPDSVCPT